jgi:hypothetical protein
MAETPSDFDMSAPNADRRRGGKSQFGFHMRVDVAEMLTAGREAAYLLPTMKKISLSADAEELARTLYLPHCIEPDGMCAAFQPL